MYGRSSPLKMESYDSRHIRTLRGVGASDYASFYVPIYIYIYKAGRCGIYFFFSVQMWERAPNKLRDVRYYRVCTERVCGPACIGRASR